MRTPWRNRRSRRYGPAAIVASLALGGWTSLAPQHVAGQESRTPVPTLYGHAFVEAPMLLSPFVRTTAMNSVGAGSASNVDHGTILLPSGDTLVALEGSITVATLEFAYQHALREWLGARGRVRVGARTGTEATSLLTNGVTFAVGFDLGWLARLRQTNRSVLSASFDVRTQSATFVDLRRWVGEIVAGEPAQLVRTTPTLRVGGGLHYAWVLNETVAFSGSFEGARGEAIPVREDRWFFSGGLGASVNLAEKHGVPVGFGLSVMADAESSLKGASDGAWQAVGFRMAYTGREDVRISMTLEFSRVPFDADADMTVRALSLDMRYYF